MFWDTLADEALDPLTELIQQPNVQLCDVLNEGTMLQELRTANAELIGYLSQENVIAELTQWSMTLDFKDKSDFHHLSRTATETLTCPAFTNSLIKSNSLKKFIGDFLESSGEWDSLCTGHFQRLFILLVEKSPDYVRNFPTILDNIVKHLDLPAVAELLVALTVKFEAQGVLPKRVVPLLITFIVDTDSDITTPLYALRQIFRGGWEVPEIQMAFMTEEAVAGLLKAAAKTSNKMAKVEIYRLLSELSRSSVAGAELVMAHSSEFPNGNVETSDVAFAVRNNIGDLKSALSLVINGNVHWGLASQLIELLNAAPQTDFMAAVDDVAALEKLKAAVAENRLTAPQLAVVSLIEKYEPGSERLAAAVTLEVVAKAALVGVRYGGHVPNSDNSSNNRINAE